MAGRSVVSENYIQLIYERRYWVSVIAGRKGAAKGEESVPFSLICFWKTTLFFLFISISFCVCCDNIF